MSPALTALPPFYAEADAGSMEAAGPEGPGPAHGQPRAAPGRISLHGESLGPASPASHRLESEFGSLAQSCPSCVTSLSLRFLTCKWGQEVPGDGLSVKVNGDCVCGPDPGQACTREVPWVPSWATPSTSGTRASEGTSCWGMKTVPSSKHDTVVCFTISFLFLLHKTHCSSSNRNHKKKKQSGTVPCPEHSDSVQPSHCPAPHHHT